MAEIRESQSWAPHLCTEWPMKHLQRHSGFFRPPTTHRNLCFLSTAPSGAAALEQHIRGLETFLICLKMLSQLIRDIIGKVIFVHTIKLKHLRGLIPRSCSLCKLSGCRMGSMSCYPKWEIKAGQSQMCRISLRGWKSKRKMQHILEA